MQTRLTTTTSLEAGRNRDTTAPAAAPGRSGFPRGRGAAPARCHGFSLLEVLCVLLVLSILYGFVLSSVTALRKAGEKRHAQTEAVALAQAVKDYRRVYGRWPGTPPESHPALQDIVYHGAGGPYSQTNVIGALLQNPRGITFLELPPALATNLVHLDPWNNPYLIAMDTNNDGRLVITVPGATSFSVQAETVGVMSYGIDGATNTVPIRSWEVHHAQP